MSNEALLALEDGTIFRGVSVGVSGSVVGEVVFNTSLTGYQEILTDPSYTGQLVTLTSPNIGNVGTNQYDQESSNVSVKGLIVRNISLLDSNFRSEESLPRYLKRNQVVAIADIDTRKLTRLLRQNGSQKGCLIAGTAPDASLALEMARAFSGLDGVDLASEVTAPEPYSWTQGSYSFLPDQPTLYHPVKLPYHVVVYDFGVKRNILRMLVDRGCHLTVVPANTTAESAISLRPDGIFLSNGPGDPAACQGAIKCIQAFLQHSIPLFGICLGHQLLALACGARTIKMKFGHHGSNHPVRDLIGKRVMITAQNHSFAVDQETLPTVLEATHRSLFDGSLQGIRHTEKPAFGFQGHPEASPGPQDVTELFDQFLASITAHQQVESKEYCAINN